MYPENPEGTQVIVGSMNMGYISDTARNRTHNLFRPKRESIPLGHNDLLALLAKICCYKHFITVHQWTTKSEWWTIDNQRRKIKSFVQCYYRELERNKNENDYNIVRPNEN